MRGCFYRIHENVCAKHRELRADGCEDFLSAEEMYSLPCRVWDTVYRICPVYGDSDGGGAHCERCAAGRDCGNVGYVSGARNIIAPVKVRQLSWIAGQRSNSGKIFFVSREEARAYIARREGSENG